VSDLTSIVVSTWARPDASGGVLRAMSWQSDRGFEMRIRASAASKGDDCSFVDGNRREE
jgi:hypothetical protein